MLTQMRRQLELLVNVSGECGVRISKIEAEDYGKWQCAARLMSHKSSDFLMRDIVLTEPSMPD